MKAAIQILLLPLWAASLVLGAAVWLIDATVGASVAIVLGMFRQK